MISKNLHALRLRINEVSEKCGRTPDDVKIVAVSKRFPVSAIQEAVNSGQTLFGENYIQEAQQKSLQLGDDIDFHFIGHLQSNKAKIAAQLFTMIETIDSEKLALALNRHLEKLDKYLNILIQVNIGRDQTKSGVFPERTEELVETILPLSRLRLKGLMTMPPWTNEPEDARPHFRNLRKLAEELQKKNLFFDNDAIELSMGMSHDFHIAVEEGATLIRVGTAIFGQRPLYKIT